MDPVGPLPAQRYWLRRILASLVALLMLVAMAWLVGWLLGGDNLGPARALPRRPGPVGTAPVPDPTGAMRLPGVVTGAVPSQSGAPVPAASGNGVSAPRESLGGWGPGSAGATAGDPASPTPGAPYPATPAPAPQPAGAVPAPPGPQQQPGPAPGVPAAAPAPAPPPAPPAAPGPCPDQAIGLTAQTARPDYPAGAHVALRLVITNVGPVACYRDVGAAAQELVVRSADGRDRVWSSNDCYPGPGADPRLLQPGEQVVSPVTWSGLTSAPGCAVRRTPAGRGDYQVVPLLAGLAGPPAPLRLT
jgi:hypothetical protein